MLLLLAILGCVGDGKGTPADDTDSRYEVITAACDVTGFARDVDLAGLQLVEVYECCDGTCYPAEGWSVTGDLFEGRCSCGDLELHVLREP